MSFDAATGELWAGDVGQDRWEEVDVIVKGGNYGWNLREGGHPWGEQGSAPRPDLIEPVSEYGHDRGGCVVGGHVYRGMRIPLLRGAYLFADYITGRVWGLRRRGGQTLVREMSVRLRRALPIDLVSPQRRPRLTLSPRDATAAAPAPRASGCL